MPSYIHGASIKLIIVLSKKAGMPHQRRGIPLVEPSARQDAGAEGPRDQS
jgi:hypothetical protein